MPLVVWVTLVLAAVVIAIVAVALLRVIFHSREVHFTLGAVVVGVRAIAHQTGTVIPRSTRTSSRCESGPRRSDWWMPG